MKGAGPTPRVYDDPQALMQGAAELVIAAATEALAAHGTFAWALAGGSTPGRLYSLLAHAPYLERIAWGRVHFFWGDERCVPPDHPESNYRMARDCLLDTVRPQPHTLHRMPGELEPATGADAYEEELRRFFARHRPAASAPRLDLVLLGMGPDGHTASLFPGSPALEETERWVVPAHVDQAVPWRLTLTLPVLNAAARVVFLVSGRDKAAPVEAVLSGRASALPAGRVRPTHGNVQWLLDAPAAARMGSL